jgi:hypothetical protein
MTIRLSLVLSIIVSYQNVIGPVCGQINPRLEIELLFLCWGCITMGKIKDMLI